MLTKSTFVEVCLEFEFHNSQDLTNFECDGFRVRWYHSCIFYTKIYPTQFLKGMKFCLSDFRWSPKEVDLGGAHLKKKKKYWTFFNFCPDGLRQIFNILQQMSSFFEKFLNKFLVFQRICLQRLRKGIFIQNFSVHPDELLSF
jgi:hypothetical protein